MMHGIVVGAGPGGLAAALALQRSGIDVSVFERAASSWHAGSGLTLWPNAFKALDYLGAGNAVREHCLPLDGIAVRAANGQVLSATPRAILEGLSGESGAALLRSTLVSQLASLLERPPEAVECVGFRDDDQTVTAILADGREVSGDVLLGADGHASVVARQLFGRLPVHYAGYAVWRGVAAATLDDTSGTMMLGRGAQFGYFPMIHDQVYWFAALNVGEGSRKGGAEDRHWLMDRFAGWHTPVRDLIQATDPDALIVTDIYERAPLSQWSRGRVSLLGDAAHPSTPNLGQGACQAIEDAAVVASCLSAHADVARALRAYEARRAGRANAMTAQARTMGQIGQWRWPAACWLRDAMIRWSPRSFGLRNLRWMFDFQL